MGLQFLGIRKPTEQLGVHVVHGTYNDVVADFMGPQSLRTHDPFVGDFMIGEETNAEMVPSNRDTTEVAPADEVDG